MVGADRRGRISGRLPRASARLRGSVGVAIALLATMVATSAFSADGWLDPLNGEWSGRGRFNGNDAEYHLSVEPALAGRFVRLRVRYVWRDAAGADASFHGEVLYPAQAASPAGMTRGSWFDSEGHQYVTSAYRDSSGRGDRALGRRSDRGPHGISRRRRRADDHRQFQAWRRRVAHVLAGSPHAHR